MALQFQVIFSRRVSSFLSLLVVFLVALALGAIILHKSSKLATLQKPMPLYINELTN